MKSFLPVLIVAFLVATIVTIARPTVSASPKATAERLKQLEGEFMKAAAEKGSQGYMSYYADDSVEVPNGGPLIQGKVEIAKGMGFLDDKNNQLDAGRRRYLRLRRSRLHVRHIRIPLEK
jgi:hypothetical protein